MASSPQPCGSQALGDERGGRIYRVALTAPSLGFFLGFFRHSAFPEKVPADKGRESFFASSSSSSYCQFAPNEPRPTFGTCGRFTSRAARRRKGEDGYCVAARAPGGSSTRPLPCAARDSWPRYLNGAGAARGTRSRGPPVRCLMCGERERGGHHARGGAGPAITQSQLGMCRAGEEGEAEARGRGGQRKIDVGSIVSHLENFFNILLY
jgi:hypothetical protein